MKDQLVSDFASPGAEFRGKPFWAWNGKLEPAELRRQIRVMKRMGLGGFFMHSRVGLATAYLSDDWFTCVDACIDEARKLGMEAWLYDEDRWPSGAAGGLVTKNPKHRMRYVTVRTLDTAAAVKWTKDTLGIFVARIDGAVARNVRPLRRGCKVPKPGAGEKLVSFTLELQPCSSWYNGYTYLDTLSHAAVKEFIRVTHAVYKKRCGKSFGGTVPGIFTDEPNYGTTLGHDNNTGHPGGLPWTGSLPATFRGRYGYDLLPHLMELVYDVDGNGMTPARYHYHDCVTHLYVDAFCRQIGKWCAANNLLFTGHQLEEDTLSSQTNMVGSCMRTYEFMQAPGMDLLTEHWRVFNTAKQVSSGARQFGWKWRLTETYGCTGWDFPFLGHKALGDWQVALGINLRCQHLAWYTMEGQAKRDYPASISFQSPWWETYSKVEDYFARVLSVMTRGQEVRDLLVVHPVESMWMLVKNGWRARPETAALDASCAKLTDVLLSAHLDFDFGDEELMSRHAKVVKDGDVPILKVGKAVYKAVLVPPMMTMRRSTLELLQKAKAAGCPVVFAGEIPSCIEGAASGEVAAFAASCERFAAVGPDVVRPLEAACRRVSIVGAAGHEIESVLYLLREDKEALYLFICNTSLNQQQLAAGWSAAPLVRERTDAFPEVRVRGFAECAGEPLELDPETGERFAAEAVRGSSGWDVATSLPALASRVFVFPRKRQATSLPVRRPLHVVRLYNLAGERWDYALSESNCLVLDRPRWKIDSGSWQPAEEILRVDGHVRQALGLTPRGGAMVQPWALEKNPQPKSAQVSLNYGFEIANMAGGDIFLAIEQPGTFRIAVNGEPVNTDAECGWWTDKSLRKLRFDPAVLRTGRNEITMVCNYSEEHPGLEIAYLLGTFGVVVDGTRLTVSRLPDSLWLGDWTGQGLPFYSGSVVYRTMIRPQLGKDERLFVHVPDYRGTAVRVLVDGASVGLIAWEPNELDITKYVGTATSFLGLELIGHRRNSHGPLHLAKKWPDWTGPSEFTTEGQDWIDGYQLVPCGLMRPPELVVKR